MEYVSLRSEWRKGERRGQRAVLSPYLREQATIYDCRLSIINSYKLLLLLAVCLAAKGGTERGSERGSKERQAKMEWGTRGSTTLCTCVCGQLLTTLNNQHDLWER